MKEFIDTEYNAIPPSKRMDLKIDGEDYRLTGYMKGDKKHEYILRVEPYCKHYSVETICRECGKHVQVNEDGLYEKV